MRAAVTLSLGLLHIFSIYQSTGQLIRMIREMMNDFGSFLWALELHSATY